MKFALKFRMPLAIVAITLAGLVSSCQKQDLEEVLGAHDEKEDTASSPGTASGSAGVLLVIDEESIDNGNPPNNFSERDVNDQLAAPGQRTTLRYFKSNIGKTIQLYTGEVGDEGWHALKTIPNSWKSAGPTTNGAQNFRKAGRGLGTGNNDPEVLLDKIPNVTPLRATGLKMLLNQTVLAVVYDSDVSINYSPLNANLQGSNLGLVALKVEKVTKRTNGSSGSLPVVTVKIMNVETVKTAPIKLFSNAPIPKSSSEPFDINPPASAPTIQLASAP